MDINLVRSRFQKQMDFFVSSNYTKNKIQFRYSLQQNTLAPSKIHLFITAKNDIRPDLVGRYINIKGQLYLVFDLLKEPFNKDQWTYELLPMSEYIQLQEVIAIKNAIGGTKQLETDGNIANIDGNKLQIINGVFPAHIKESLSVNKTQIVNTGDILFYLAKNSEIKLNRTYIIYYEGLRFKQTSLGVTSGAIILHATREQ